MSYQVKRYHDICAGHRVHGHEGKCQHLHGHNYRVTFTCAATVLDTVGRVIDFSEIKAKLCMWWEDNWVHKMLIWQEDPMLPFLQDIDKTVVSVPFIPTAENIAEHLVKVVGPAQLEGTGIQLVHCEVEETRKCSATYSL